MNKWNERKKKILLLISLQVYKQKEYFILSIFDLDACFLNAPDCQNYILTSLKVYIFINSKI